MYYYVVCEESMKAFISHSSIDKPLARQVADEIRVRGHDVWLDERDLGAGQPLGSTLSEALSDIDVFVIILTENSVASPWVLFELNQAIPMVVSSATRMLPLKFDSTDVPSSLRGFIYADCSSWDGLKRALNLTFASASFTLPLSPSEIDVRYAERVMPEFCIRLVLTADLSNTDSLGSSSRQYVALGDYFEQCGRPLRDIMENLFVAKYLDAFLKPDDKWSAVVIAAGALYEKKLDLLPGTWKSIYRVLTDRRRLNLCTPSQFHSDLGSPPRDYWEGDQTSWMYAVRSELHTHGYEDETHLPQVD
jgi:TIR domain